MEINQSIKIAYVTTFDPQSILSWSGIGYYMLHSLKKDNISIDYIGPLKEIYSYIFKGKQLLYKYFLGKRYLRDREPIILRYYANQVHKRLAGLDADIVFSPGTIPIAFLESNKHIVFWTDAPFAGMIDFYPGFSNLCQETIRNGHAVEASALTRSRLAIYSSEWAARTAMENYPVDPAKIKIVPFGANLECNRDLNDIRAIIDSRSSQKCKLLFLGVDWLRKGGDIAIEVAKRLNQGGLATELFIVGCEPAGEIDRFSFINALGFISKSRPEGRKKLYELLGECHFLILPSLAEATPIVFCEANSFGTPCLSTNIGGIPSIIKNGVNGKLFARETLTEDCCNYIYYNFRNYSQYKELCLSSFNEYQSRLNWKVAGKLVQNMLFELL